MNNTSNSLSNRERIYFTTPKGEYSIPNRWELLTPNQFLHLCKLIAEFAAGNATTHDVRLHYVCKMLGIKLKKQKMSMQWQI
jgi:hypothetical protein